MSTLREFIGWPLSLSLSPSIHNDLFSLELCLEIRKIIKAKFFLSSACHVLNFSFHQKSHQVYCFFIKEKNFLSGVCSTFFMPCQSVMACVFLLLLMTSVCCLGTCYRHIQSHLTLFQNGIYFN